MRVGIIASTKDPASMNIRKWLLDMYDFKEKGENYEFSDYGHEFVIHTTDKELISADNIDSTLGADVIIFVSKHVSEAGRQAFTVHPIGNWGAAELGGEIKTLVTSPAMILKELFIKLNELNGIGCEVAMEATHHGPLVKTPSVFLEIGSNEEQWKDEDAGRIIGTVLISAFAETLREYKVAIAIGGPHYTPNFVSTLEGPEYAISHICSKHNLPNFDIDMLKQAIEKSEPKADIVLVDIKGLGTEKQRVLDVIQQAGIESKNL